MFALPEAPLLRQANGRKKPVTKLSQHSVSWIAKKAARKSSRQNILCIPCSRPKNCLIEMHHWIRWFMRLGTAAALRIACASVFVALSLHLPSQFSRTSTVTLDTSTPVPFFIDDGSKAPGFRPGDAELAKWALDAW